MTGTGRVYCTPEAMKDFMAQQHYSARDLADALGYSRQSIYAMANGQADIPLCVALAMAAIEAKLKPYGATP